MNYRIKARQNFDYIFRDFVRRLFVRVAKCGKSAKKSRCSAGGRYLPGGHRSGTRTWRKHVNFYEGRELRTGTKCPAASRSHWCRRILIRTGSRILSRRIRAEITVVKRCRSGGFRDRPSGPEACRTGTLSAVARGITRYLARSDVRR